MKCRCESANGSMGGKNSDGVLFLCRCGLALPLKRKFSLLQLFLSHQVELFVDQVECFSSVLDKSHKNPKSLSTLLTITFMHHPYWLVILVPFMTISAVRAFTISSNHLNIMKTRSASTKVMATAKKATAAKAKKPAAKKKESPASPTKATTVTMNVDGPWWDFFTKEDEEYNAYMGNEWGFEKVGSVTVCQCFSFCSIVPPDQ